MADLTLSDSCGVVMPRLAYYARDVVIGEGAAGAVARVFEYEVAATAEVPFWV